MVYTHSFLSLNHKQHSLSDIQQGLVRPASTFEESTLSFIQAWLANQSSFVLQTSGSTGTPKKITVNRSQLIASARATLAVLQIPENSKALIAVPTQYIAGIMMIVRSIIGNLQMFLVEPSANPLAKFYPDESFDFAALTPYQVDSLVDQYGLSGIDSIKTILIGGAPLSPVLREKIASTRSSVYLTYGMTETLSHIALQKISGEDRKDFFTTLPSVSISVDERQCLIVEASYLAERAVTNDVIELLSPISFRWLGRWDNVINSGGIKLFPEKIEEAIGFVFQKMGISANFFVEGLEDEKLGTRAVLVVESHKAFDEASFFSLVGQYLDRREIPKKIFYTQHFEMTATGKIKRKETLQKLPV